MTVGDGEEGTMERLISATENCGSIRQLLRAILCSRSSARQCDITVNRGRLVQSESRKSIRVPAGMRGSDE